MIIYWNDGTVTCTRDYAPKPSNGRRVGSEQHKECVSVESKGFWQGTKPKAGLALHTHVGDGMVENSSKEHL